MANCSDLFVLSSLACNIADCLDDDQLALTAARLTTLSDMLTTIAAQRAITSSSCAKQDVAGKTTD